jgi:hypothetical protein
MPPITRRLTAAGLALAVGAGAAAVPATSLAKATGPGTYKVTHTTYTFHQGPAKGWDGTLFRGDHIKVKRLSPSGKWVLGHAYGHVNRDVWVTASALRKGR